MEKPDALQNRINTGNRRYGFAAELSCPNLNSNDYQFSVRGNINKRWRSLKLIKVKIGWEKFPSVGLIIMADIFKQCIERTASAKPA